MAVNEWLTAAMLVAAGLLAADAVSADVGSTPSPAGGAQAQASSSSVTAVLDLVLNTAPRGELLVLLDRGEVWAEVAGLEAAGLTGFSGERMTRGERAFVRLGSIDPPLTVSLDEHALSLSITADVSLFRHTIVQLDAQRPAGIMYTRAPSAFLNYGASWASGSSSGLNLESGVSAGPALLTSSLFLAGHQRATRGLTSVTFDDRRRLRRWVLGDAVVATGPLGGALQMAGVSVSRDFSIDPYFIRYPTTALSGVVTTPSRVELYVNHQLVRTLQLQPGQYELADLALPTGTADTRLVVRDAFGGEQSFGGSYYVTTSVLARGLHQYHYAAGAERLRPFADLWAYGRPVGTALHRVGLTDAVTIGGRAEAEPGLFSGGPSLSARLGRFGALEVALAASRHAGQAGVGGSVAYEYSAERGSIGAAWRQASASYATLSTRRGGRATRHELLASATLRVLRRGTLGLTWQTQGSHAGEDDYTRAGVTSTFSLSSRMNAFATVSRSRFDGAWSTTAYTGLSLGIGPRASSSLSYEHVDGRGRLLADVQRAAPIGPGVGYRVQAATASQAAALVDGELRAQTRWAQLDVQHSVISGSSGLYGQINGALVAIGGRVLATRPVQNGFALVRVPQVGGVRAFVSQQEIGRTDRHGDVLVPNLLPYYGNHISIADADVPIDRSLVTNRMLLAPPYRGGAIAEFGVSRQWRVAGRFVVDADPLALRGQRAIDARVSVEKGTGTIESGLGLDGEFYVEGLAPGAYRAHVEYSDGACDVALDVPESDAPVIRVGTLLCTRAAGAVR